ncbi:L-lactate dehydrogenase [Microbacterium faecale]|uniref:L-lactate dehydrogenase n=1 Tax=Microbacterium faecale TaxID=1804630 RepID=A0A916Y4D9_9MICO|nr:hypothetical protein [Microbacterium faecale]GGD30339.1 L-lactate dehydrogenase [Microbacterium faecale]
MTSATIIGAAGGIGQTVAAEFVARDLFDELHLVDLRTNLLEADRIDLSEASVAAGHQPPHITVEDPHSALHALGSSDFVVCAATLGEKPGQSRSSFAQVNWELLISLVPLISQVAGEHGTVLLVTNPVDAMAERLAREETIPRDRIIGYSVNDSTRLRVAIAAEVGVEPDRVQAHALGVHGEQLVPLYSGVRIDDEPVELDAGQRQRIDTWTEGWFARWHELKSGRSSIRSTAAGVASVVRATRSGAELPLSVSTDSVDFLPSSAFIGLPTSFAGGSAAVSDAFECTSEEKAALVEAATAVRDLAGQLGRG